MAVFHIAESDTTGDRVRSCLQRLQSALTKLTEARLAERDFERYERAVHALFVAAEREVLAEGLEALDVDQSEMIREQDLLITPDLGDLTAFGSFERVDEAVQKGLEAGRANARRRGPPTCHSSRATAPWKACAARPPPNRDQRRVPSSGMNASPPAGSASQVCASPRARFARSASSVARVRRRQPPTRWSVKRLLVGRSERRTNLRRCPVIRTIRSGSSESK